MSRFHGLALGLALTGLAAGGPAQAYLFWSPPALGGAPVTGEDPAIVLKLNGANPAEQKAGLIWTMRAGLNVAALQCQFAPALQTVANYNNMLRQHAAELQSTYGTLSGYFKRTGGKTWQTALDTFTTRTYNSFSTLDAQIIFCETAAAIGRDTMQRPKGQLAAIASERMREFRNSLKPVGDQVFAAYAPKFAPMAEPQFDEAPVCVDRKGRPKKKC